MNKLKMIVAGLLGLAIAIAPVPVAAAETQFGHIAYLWDADSVTMTFPLLLGRDGTIFGSGNPGLTPVSTSGSSTTVAATTASTSPFALVSVGDVLEFRVDNTSYLRVVTVRTDADTVTVNAAITLTAAAFSWYKLTVGTAETAGWFDVSSAESITFTVDPQNIAVDTGGVDLRIDCKGGSLGSTSVQVYPSYTDGSADTVTNLSAEGLADRVIPTISGNYGSCRVGIQVDDDDAVDTTTAMEEIHITVAIRRTNR